MMKFAFGDPVFFWLADLITAEKTELACRINVGSSVAELHKGEGLGDGGSARVVLVVAEVVDSSRTVFTIDALLGAETEVVASRNATRDLATVAAGGPTTLVGFEEGRESSFFT